MEEYLKVIFLATPGFIAQRVALWFGNSSTSKSTFDHVMTYAVYSLVCISLSLFVITCVCIYPGINLNATINQLVQIQPTLKQILETSVCIIFISSLTGAVWQLVIKNY